MFGFEFARNELQFCQSVSQPLKSTMATVRKMSNVAKDIEVERDFYFNKVVAIEQVLKKEQVSNKQKKYKSWQPN